jgi:hypothetical protein
MRCLERELSKFSTFCASAKTVTTISGITIFSVAWRSDDSGYKNESCRVVSYSVEVQIFTTAIKVRKVEINGQVFDIWRPHHDRDNR